ncbi:MULTISPECIES: TrgA family protein [unclassified Leisingera]|uniref:TrgA family protein n=1 Tax=unclassified Leisingera TaxID=2614906 RepID=UPI0010104C23|nr:MULTISPECIES: TrgA family protein [unclassified Leisingera]MBQ4824621.1 TrgA family protein [Leisingera sp. HS039]MCF6431258.1 TrgA family protein [Leisingera sp. MMG026]QAX29872.1 TrgA family protein [Leisingera sp. NJS204]QBR36604.1 TrgA family protein [Leisingera sp. NJS201]
MPTGARLTAAFCLALVAFFVSFLVMPLMPEGTDFGYFVHVNVALGLLSGWIFMGKRAGRGLVPGINNGLTGMAVMVLWALFIQGTWEMFRLAMRHRYGGPFEALSQIFVIALEYFFVIAVPSVLVPLAVGGVLAGLATENASRRWR